MEEIYAKFVSQKISKTRWRPVPPGSLQTTETFATGSWDNEENYVSLWSIGDFGNLDSDGGFEGDHQLLCDIRHHGDVMDLQFFDQERIVAASSTGCVTVFLHHPNNQTLSVSQQWTAAHHHTGPGSPSCSSAPCTGVVCSNPEIVTVGEDGRINLFRADHKEAIRTIDNADSSTLHAVTFLRTPEILTVNSIGQLKIWDFRQQGNEPSQILSLTGDRVPLHCVDRHPNQQHVVATGGQDGMLSIWDVRQGTMPVSLLKAHEAEMWEVHFHPSNPDHLFTCSEDGSLWHWDASTDVPEKSSLFYQVTHRSTSHGQGLPGRQMAREPGKRSLSLQYIVEHSKVGKETARRKRSGPNTLMPMKKSEENRRMKNQWRRGRLAGRTFEQRPEEVEILLFEEPWLDWKEPFTIFCA
ncbi:nucleoporin Nup43 isoform X2 [Eschrichtius robustus]|uniref:nucleoporin Nup43 isoform X2 n=1 Tax=Eschrichtius robustus TaxID=9764 RepID=UPI0035C1C232